jgi:hypothetical protein
MERASRISEMIFLCRAAALRAGPDRRYLYLMVCRNCTASRQRGRSGLTSIGEMLHVRGLRRLLNHVADEIGARVGHNHNIDVASSSQIRQTVAQAGDATRRLGPVVTDRAVHAEFVVQRLI